MWNKLLHTLFYRAQETEEMSADWREEYLLKLIEMGHVRKRNYNGIVLFSIPGENTSIKQNHYVEILEIPLTNS